jgi:hypothetical protein
VDYARVKYPGLRTKVCLPGRRVTISV